jgi:hypothetical protein
MACRFRFRIEKFQTKTRGPMIKNIDYLLEQTGWRKVATGTWLYDRTVPMPASIWAKPAHLASSRFDEDDQLDESAPIPATKDGYLYCGWPYSGGDHLTIEEAKAAASAAPWGPIAWDEFSN